MGKIPSELREIIAWNVRHCRLKKFPGRGGQKKCAEVFDVSPQQWSPWERGKRTPDEVRLTQIAEFFNVTVEWMRCDHRPQQGKHINQNQTLGSLLSSLSAGIPPPGIERTMRNAENTGKTAFPAGCIEGVDVPPPPLWEPAPPGSAASFFWLLRHFIIMLETQGVRLDTQSLEHLARLIKSTRS